MDSFSSKSIKGYQLNERIGTGGFGAVYRAHQTTIQREVAIKVILPGFANNPEFIRRFESEAHFVSRLEHPFIVPLYDYWRDPDGAYIVMRYLRGGSLLDSLKKNVFDLQSTERLLDQITSALSVAHRHKVIHRDLKPGNILLDEDGNAYLSDFGIAKDIKNTSGGITEPDQLIGSPAYLAPEQARGDEVTPQTDIYSLGVIIYEMLVGEHPFPNLSSVERIFKHLNEPLPLISKFDPDIQDSINALIQKATQKNPENRYLDIHQLMTAFRQAISSIHQGTQSNVVELLTAREQEVLQCMLDGLNNNQIANKLFITTSTVKWYMRQIYKKLGVRSRVQAIVRARELNLVVNTDTAVVNEASPVTISDSQLPEPVNPYKGLRAFQSGDESDFYGREKLTGKLVSRLSEKVENARFLAVVGPSGSGKTSLVKAGLIPALWRGEIPGSEKWYIVEMMPGSRPMDELEVALIRVAANHAENIRDQIERDKNGLLRVAQLILPQDDSELLLIIDQFEELFTLTETELERGIFLNLIHAAVTEKRSRVRVILTLRADFYDRPLMYPQFGALVQERTQMVLPLSAMELESAIANPASREGVQFEEGLVAQIISDINYQPGALPLLQYAMTELFENREGHMLTHAAYEAIGGTVGALASRAEEIYNELDDEGKEIARQVFLRLVAVGEDTRSTRRRTSRDELGAVTKNSELLGEIIDLFTEYRLISLDNDPATRIPTVEVAHELLLDEWQRLKLWIAENLADVRFERLLATAAQDWFQNGKKSGYLLHGARLTKFENWAQATTMVLTDRENEYLAASAAEREHLAEIEKEQQAREAALENRARQFLLALTGVFLLAAIIGTGLAVVAFDQRDAALREASVNLSLVQSNNALKEFEQGQTDLALALALQAVSVDDIPEQSEQILRQIAGGVGTHIIFGEHKYGVSDVEFTPDGQLAISSGCAAVDTSENCSRGEILIWRTDSGTLVSRWDNQAGTINAIAISSNGELIASGSEDGMVLLWDFETGEIIHQLEGHQGPVMDVDFDAGSNYVASGSADGSIILWDIETGELAQRLVGHTGAVNSIVLNRKGQLLSGSDDNTLILWDIETGNNIRQFEGHHDRVLSVAFLPDNNRVISASADVFVHEWNIETGEILRTEQYAAPVNDIALTPNGQLAFIVTRRVVNLFDVASWTRKFSMFDHTDTVLHVSVSPDSQRLITGSADGTLRVWDLYPDTNYRRFDSAGMPLWRMALSHDEKYALTGTWAGQAILWDVAGGNEIKRFDGHENLVASVDFSPDDRTVLVGAANQASGMNSNSLILWGIETGNEIRRFEGHIGGVIGSIFNDSNNQIITSSQLGGMGATGTGELIIWDADSGELLKRIEDGAGIGDLALSPDGQYIVSGSYQQRAVSLWDSENGLLLKRFEGHTDLVSDVAFMPDGKYILTSSLDTTLMLWDIETGERVRMFVGHSGPIWGISVSADGLSAASASQDGTIIVWDIETGRELRRLAIHQGSVSDITFIKNDSAILSSSFDGTIIEWQISNRPLDDLIQWIHVNRYIRDFTCAERMQYRIQPLCR